MFWLTRSCVATQLSYSLFETARTCVSIIACSIPQNSAHCPW